MKRSVDLLVSAALIILAIHAPSGPAVCLTLAGIISLVTYLMKLKLNMW